MERCAAASAEVIETDVPSRLDRLSWGRFHTLVVVALGVTWVLDGLEVTLAGAVAPALKASPQLQFSNADVGLASSAYIAGAVLGALFFGWLADRLGRKRLFFITLAVYLLATAATALSWNFWSFALFRFLTGAGIGGEYTAINSTIQELVPARYRGWTDLVINGSFWVGAALGALVSIVLLDPALLPPDMGWRLSFFIGAALGLVIDRVQLCRLRHSARRLGLLVRNRCAERRRADRRVDGGVLLRLGGGELGLSDRERDVSARGARAGHRLLLRPRHRSRRRRGTLAVRQLDRQRLALERARRLSDRRDADDCRRGHCRSFRHRRRAQAARGGGPAIGRCRPRMKQGNLIRATEDVVHPPLEGPGRGGSARLARRGGVNLADRRGLSCGTISPPPDRLRRSTSPFQGEVIARGKLVHYSKCDSPAA
jgi:hypothetical protein